MTVPATPAAPDAPAFTPGPRQTQRGFTADRQRRFIAALAATGSVTTAAAEVGMTRQAAYVLRAAPGAQSFAAAWDTAIARGIAALKAVAFDRAIHGEPAPVYFGGTQVGETRVFNNQLLMRLLTHYDPQTPAPAEPRETVAAAVAARYVAQLKPMPSRNPAERQLACQWAQFQAYEKARAGRSLAATIRHWLAESPEHLENQLTRLETRARDNAMLAAETNPEIAARADAARAGLDWLTARLTAELVEAYHAAGLIPHVDLPA